VYGSDARVRASDPYTDLAVLEVDASDLPAARFTDDLPRVGEPVLAVGNPLGFEGTVTSGIVSGLHRDVPSGGRTPALVDLIQTDAPISPGNSGGALVALDGRVVGINVAYLPPAQGAVSIGFAIPAPTVTDVVDDLLDDGVADHPYLGVALSQLTPQIAERFDIQARSGAIVGTVAEDSPAMDAGLMPGDVVVEFAGRRVIAVEDVYAAIRENAPGDTVELSVIRDGRPVTLRARLDARR
jgi:serine protease Do